MSTLIYIFVTTDAITIQTDPAWAVPQDPTAQENDGEAGESLWIHNSPPVLLYMYLCNAI